MSRRFDGLRYLVRMKAPLRIFMYYLRDKLNVDSILSADRMAARDTFRNSTKSGSFTTDWFTWKIPYWISAFEKAYRQQQPIRALEIGSWEGRSTVFMLDHFPDMQMVCVDTWAGAHGHQQDPRWQSSLSDIEQHFDANIKTSAARVTKYKGTSQAYFATLPSSETFDLIYVDGSHFADDVLCDAVNAWAHLAPGGVMILDDYLWRMYRQENSNPAWAINTFLRYIGEYTVIHAYYQMILQKPISSATLVQRQTMPVDQVAPLKAAAPLPD